MALSVWVSIRHQGWVALSFDWEIYSELQPTTNVVSAAHHARSNFVTNVSVRDIRLSRGFEGLLLNVSRLACLSIPLVIPVGWLYYRQIFHALLLTRKA